MRRYIILIIAFVAVLTITGIVSASQSVVSIRSSSVRAIGQTKTESIASPTSTPMIHPSLTVANSSCLLHSGVQFCIKSVSTDNNGTHILLETKVMEQGVRLLPRPYFPDEDQKKPFLLVDDQGRTFQMSQRPDAPLPFDAPLGEGETGTSLQTLDFASLPSDAKSVTLHVPAIAVQIPLSQSVTLNIGSDPKGGDRFQTNSKIQVVGQMIDFVQAKITAPIVVAEGTIEVNGDAAGTSIDANQLNQYTAPSLRLTIFSAPIIVQEQPKIMTLLVNGEGFPVSGVGFNPDTRQFEVDVELLNPNGQLVKTGTINVPIIGAQLLWQDVQLSWDMSSNHQ